MVVFLITAGVGAVLITAGGGGRFSSKFFNLGFSGSFPQRFFQEGAIFYFFVSIAQNLDTINFGIAGMLLQYFYLMFLSIKFTEDSTKITDMPFLDKGFGIILVCINFLVGFGRRLLGNIAILSTFRLLSSCSLSFRLSQVLQPNRVLVAVANELYYSILTTICLRALDRFNQAFIGFSVLFVDAEAKHAGQPGFISNHSDGAAGSR